MGVMAAVRVEGGTVTIVLSAIEKVEALHSDVQVARFSVVNARTVPDGMHEISGIRMPGTAVPGLIAAGTYVADGQRTFAVVHRHAPAVVLDLTGEEFDRIVVTVDNPRAVIVSLYHA